MTNFERLALVNLDTAQVILNDKSQFEGVAAELLVRNAAVIADRLQPEEFASLPERAEQAAMQAAEASILLAPLSNADLQPMPNEEDLDFHYRVGIWLPIRSLQRKLATADFDKNNPSLVDRYRHAVHLGSVAFSTILLASEDNPVVRDKERYFWSNTKAAAGRVAQSQRD